MTKLLLIFTVIFNIKANAASFCTPAEGKFGYDNATSVGGKVHIEIPVLYMDKNEKAAVIVNTDLNPMENGKAICIAYGYKTGVISKYTETVQNGWSRLVALNSDGTLKSIYQGGTGYILVSALTCEQ